MTFLKKRGQHKGENGRVLAIGGCTDYIGAPALAALAALRTGIDLSIVAAPENIAWTINTYSPDLITKKFEGEFFNWDNLKDVIEYAEDFDVIIIGNGLGTEPSTFDFVEEIIERIPQPKVIDADAFKALKDVEIVNAVLTPHEKEFKILTEEKLPTDIKKRASLLKHYADKRKVFLLKGPTDIITDRENIHYNKTGNSGMTVGGTGDILAGITAGLIAQSNDLFNSAVNAAKLNGKIGDYLLKKKGIG
ncbi:NAD(P)H-hydrate dehydratase, partial [Candidatus Woesearchaeota archaeon]|nr:NAD(P)H-hydrate dehydratase [Candidatus Woesearchaeota archaeon]